MIFFPFLVKTSDIFRLIGLRKKLPTEKYVSNLKLYVDIITTNVSVTIQDLESHQATQVCNTIQCIWRVCKVHLKGIYCNWYSRNVYEDCFKVLSRKNNILLSIQHHLPKLFTMAKWSKSKKMKKKYLEVLIDQELSGETIFSFTMYKANNRLKFLYRYKNCLNQAWRKQLCTALVLCNFDYWSNSWFLNLTSLQKHKLQITVNKVSSYILDFTSWTHIGQSELNQIGILNICDRVKLLRLNHVFKIKYRTRLPCWQSPQC